MTAILERFNNRYSAALLVGLCAGPALALLAGRTSPLVAGAVLLGMGVVAAGLNWPYAAILLTASVIPLERIGRFTNDATTLTISLMRIMGLIGIASFSIHWFIGRRRIRVTWPLVLYAIYTVIALLTLVHTSDPERAVQQSATNVGNVLFLLLITNVIERKEQVRLPVILWLITTFAIGVFSIYQWHNPNAVVQVDRYDNTGLRTTSERFSTVMEDYGEYETVGVVRRVLGPTSSPAVYGINIILTLPFYVYLFRTSKSLWARLFCVLGIAVGTYNVALTNTRAAVMALAFAFVCIALTGLVRVRFAGVLLVIIVAAVSIPFLPSVLQDRIFNLQNYTTEHSATLRIRLTYWETAVDIFADNWLLGIGTGNQIELPHRLSNMRLPANSSVHNEYFETLVETGLVGYPFIVGFMVLIYRRMRFAERFYAARGEINTSMFLTCIRIAFYTILFYALQSDVLHFTLKAWWLIAGFVVVLSEMAYAEIARTLANPPEAVVA